MANGKWILAFFNGIFVLVFFVLLAVSNYEANKSARALRLRATSTVEGLVTACHIWDHDKSDYEYVVEGKTYSNTKILADPEISVGQHLVVHYNPLNPTESYTEKDYPLEPEHSLPVAVLLFFQPFVFLFLCALAIYGLIRLVRWRKSHEVR